MVKVYPSTLSSAGGWVKVTWQYVDDPSDDDWMGVYSPPTNDGYRINPSEHAPIHVLVCQYEYRSMSSYFGEKIFRQKTGEYFYQSKIKHFKLKIIL